ncbi:MAG: galactose-1-phosphate uridylyltransferase [Candidatus Omnitrophica bacterium]|nr:galactose-1-phosphate uridylyltransferase [Candidatus Omnitrophota bacterium]
MPELRKDPVIGRWVIIATERAKRPNDFNLEPSDMDEIKPCPFCVGNENLTPPEIRSIRKEKTEADKPGWEVRVVPSRAPVLRIEGNLNKQPHGIYDMMRGVGAHEVIIETPEHINDFSSLEPGQIANVIRAYKERVTDLEGDKRFKYVLIFKNYKPAAGSTKIKHCRSQLIALPACPKSVKGELEGSRKYFEYKDRCVFCDIVSQELDDKKRLILDIDGFVAIAPFAGRFPFETWILPKKHSADFTSIEGDEITGLATILKELLLRMNKLLADPPYNYIIHTAPYRRTKAGYWSTIDQDYHWHIEIIPRLTRVAGFEWGTGFYINPTPPEEATKYLREVEVKV